jgi:hypothetical protein
MTDLGNAKKLVNAKRAIGRSLEVGYHYIFVKEKYQCSAGLEGICRNIHQGDSAVPLRQIDLIYHSCVTVSINCQH